VKPSHVISAIGHVGLQVRDLDAAMLTATQVMGLRETKREEGWIYLTHGSPHHSLLLKEGPVDALDHLSLEAAGPEGLAEIRSRLRDESVTILNDGPITRGVEDGVTIVGPAGYVFEIFQGMEEVSPTYPATGVRPTRFGHYTIYLGEPKLMIGFLERIFDFRISDFVGPGAFLRCNADHHGIGVSQHEPVRMHHIAWEVENVNELVRLADVLDDQGDHLRWGPVRHGVGRNIAAYFMGFGDLVVEYYCEMQRIYNDAEYVPGRWERTDPRFFSTWARQDIGDFQRLGLPLAQR
jgi:catechol 2,3-dioxygenase